MKKKTDGKKENVDDKDKEETKDGIQNFIDMQAFTIFLHLSGNPKTKAEMVTELKEIPKASIYRKIKEMEKYGLIKPIVLSRYKKRKKRNNIAYEITSRDFTITDRGKSFRMII